MEFLPQIIRISIVSEKHDITETKEGGGILRCPKGEYVHRQKYEGVHLGTAMLSQGNLRFLTVSLNGIFCFLDLKQEF